MQSESIKQTNICCYNTLADSYDNKYLSLFYNTEIETTRLLRLLKKNNLRINDPNLRVLEIGAGTGQSLSLVSAICSVKGHYALDISYEMVKKYENKDTNLHVMVSDAEFTCIKNKSFDIVFCRSFMHHLSTDDKIVAEINRILKTNGLFVILKEPLMGGCDFWFKVKHLPMRYGDRDSFFLLLKRLSRPKSWHKIWAYELSKADLDLLDKQEIRGAIIQHTPLKDKGGVDLDKLINRCRRMFKHHCYIKYGFFETLIESFEIFLRLNLTLKYRAAQIDYLLFSIFNNAPFESFLLVLKKD